MTSPSQTPPGWYPDPSGGGGQRYWDGNQWTDNFSGGSAPAGAPGGAVLPSTPLPSLWWGVPIAVALLVLGAIGPWASLDLEVLGASRNESESGLESDGVITLVLALISGGLLLAWREQRARWQAIVAAVLGAICVLVAIIDISDVSGTEVGAIGDVSVGWGLWVTLLGSIVLVVVSVLLMLQSRRKA